MLPDNYRLKKRRDFSRAYTRGKHDACAAFVLYCLPHRGSTAVRIGFSASKKLGHAVTRNRVKRVFRHVAAAHLAEFPPGREYIFVIRNAALGWDHQRLGQQLSKMLRTSPAVQGQAANHSGNKLARAANKQQSN